ncbi:protein kinase [Caldimonas thermodepolymerans]|jgi:Serine/threonine protein kinase|uniref:Serine/threonine protein kinase n=1 Tax=Caldimonas thermodepolymerans TaxID=215580 RepID=A0A2S5T4Y8_9BURK|nr:serine/threonine-protein kinase [Caldimonas thermodepolymerans]PPE70053.1 serine/threonine protein kinase [Caldimonas thermodepolymerans]QPC31796.1 protein kinase [Caldimonas thermodepolymerans]RDI01699.1 serine/threonine protein kinase [Caldimonas thermodepolymerans]TCP05837.1 serine/threonine protein kinase [Caldimonas thermodepolymerans]UZG44579.1 serine/threonine-protein kinase [Caldimonas thermodepolymerans]
MTAPDASVAPFTHIGDYRVLRKLGEGATSEVFLCRDEFRARDVAVKRVRDAAVRDPVDGRYYSRFFAAEAALVGRLQHPHVVQIFDASDKPEEQYLVMEYVPGSTLRNYCRADQLLPLELIVELGFKCAMALDYVFRQGLIHRDIKPANLLTVEVNGHVTDVKVSDFGSVLNLGADVTQVHRVGSLTYMSPEQLDGGQLNAQSDMYALGAVLYHLITGHPPVEADSQAAMIQRILHAPVVPPSERRHSMHPAVDEVIMRALNKRPEHRYESWEEFANALASLVTNRHVPRGNMQVVLDSERFNLLRKLDFFRNFDDVELWEVVHQARWQRFPVGHKLMKRGERGRDFHIIAQGAIEVYRDGKKVETLKAGMLVGEMAYLAPSKDTRLRTADVVAIEPITTISFTPETLGQLSLACRGRFNEAFIGVLVRRLHAAHEALSHPQRIL